MSTPEFDAVMNKMDLHDRTFKLAKSWGATDELAEVFAASQSVKFKWDGVVLSYNGKNAADDPEAKKHFTACNWIRASFHLKMRRLTLIQHQSRTRRQ